MINKLRIGVFMGGRSIEREVSFNSGRTVCDHLDTQKYDIIPLFQTTSGTLYILPFHFLHRGKISDFEHRLSSQAQKITWDNLPQLVDFMYIAVHGRYAEDGTLQGFLEILKIPYLGSRVFASAVGMNKVIQKEILAQHGIAIASGFVIQPHELASLTEKEINNRMHHAGITFPAVIKPAQEGSSLGISIIREGDNNIAAIEKAASIYAAKKQAVLFEEKIHGMEFSCICLVDQQGTWFALPPTEVVADAKKEFFDYEQKYMPGKATEFTPARVSIDDITLIQQACIKTAEVLEMKTIARIDGFFTADKKVVVVDPNTLSGMGPSSFLFREAAHINMNHSQLINYLIETELAYYQKGIPELQRKERMSSPKIKVAVLMGGESNEREISLESGRNISYKLSPAKYSSIPIFVSSTMELYYLNQQLLVRSSTKEIEQLLTPDKKLSWSDLPEIADFVFIGLHGGKGENGCVQGALEMLDMPYNGSSVLASALCMDKYKTNQFLKNKGFDVPRSLLISKEEWHAHEDDVMQRIAAQFPLPYIIKPHDDGCSVMVQKIHHADDIKHALTTIFDQNKEYALIEEYIQGMELTVGVIGNENPRALPPSQAVVSQGILSIEEKFLPGAGENQTPAPLPSDALSLVQYTVEQVFKAVGCKGYARIDCFYQSAQQSSTGKERVIILEINTLPGMTPATCIFHQAAEIGMKPMDFIDEIISLGFQEHGKQQMQSEISQTSTQTQEVAL